MQKNHKIGFITYIVVACAPLRERKAPQGVVREGRRIITFVEYSKQSGYVLCPSDEEGEPVYI